MDTEKPSKMLLNECTKYKVDLIQKLESKYMAKNTNLFIDTRTLLFDYERLRNEMEEHSKRGTKTDPFTKPLQTLGVMEILVKMDQVTEQIALYSSIKAIEEAVDNYLKHYELSLQLRNRNEADVLKEFKCIEHINSNIKFTGLCFKVTKIFSDNVRIDNYFNCPKLILRKNDLTVTDVTWTKVVQSFATLGRLHIYMESLFRYLEMKMITPILKNDQRFEVKGHELCTVLEPEKLQVSTDPLGKLLSLKVIFDFILQNMPPSAPDVNSLVEKLGENGRGFKMFKGCIDAILTEDNASSALIALFNELIRIMSKSSFISDSEERILLDIITNKISKNKKNEVLQKAASLIKSSFHNTINVGVRTKSLIEKPDPGKFFYHDPLDKIVFPKCQISLPAFELCEMIYELLDVEMKEKKRKKPTKSSEESIINETFNTTTTFYDTTMNNTTAQTTFTEVQNNLKEAMSIKISSEFISPKFTFKTKKVDPLDIEEFYRHTCRIVHLFVECRLTVNMKEVKDSAFLTAVHHNDCKWLAHHLMIIQPIMRPVKDNKPKGATENADPIKDDVFPMEYNFYKFFVLLDKTSDNTLNAYLKKIGGDIESIFKKAFEDLKIEGDRKLVANAVETCMEDVDSLMKTWMGVLDADTLASKLGILFKQILDLFLDGFLRIFDNTFDDKIIRGDNEKNLSKNPKVKDEDFKKYTNLLKKTLEYLQKSGEDLFENLPVDPEAKAPTMQKIEKILFIFDTFSSAGLVDIKWDLERTKDSKDNEEMDEEPALIRKLFEVSELRLLYCIAFPEDPLPPYLVHKPYNIIIQ